MENKFEFQNESQFESVYENLVTQTDFKRLADKFTVKPFYFKYKALKKLLGVITWFIQVVTIIVSFMSIFGLLIPMMPYYIAFTFSVISLVCIEILKRMTLKPSVKEFLQFKKVVLFPLSLALTMLVLSLWLTWNGTHETVFKLTEKPQLLNVDSLTNFEKDRIKQINSDISTAKKITWKGKITEKGQKMIDNLTQERAKIQGKLDLKENNLRVKNDQTESDHTTKTTARATHFKYLTLCLDLLLFGLLAWLEYYDYRSITEFSRLKIASENTTQNVVNTEGDTTQNVVNNEGNTTQNVVNNALRYNAGRTVIQGFRRENTTQSVMSNNASNTIKTTQNVVNKSKRVVNGEIIIIKKACENCGETFERKVTFQKFCTQNCRIKFWENKTGKKMRKAKIKK
jgi:hypothetical protein